MYNSMIPAEVIDLSVTLDASTRVYPGDPTVSLEVATTIAEEGYALQRISLGSQSGTHIDSPAHFLPGPGLAELPLERCVGPAVVARLPGLLPGHELSPADLQHVLPRVIPGCVVLLHTDWHCHMDDTVYFDHPHLGPTAAGALIERGAVMLGTDAINLGRTVLDEPWDFPVNRQVLTAGLVILENLRELQRVEDGMTICALPLKLGHTRDNLADGAPVRAVAIRWL